MQTVSKIKKANKYLPKAPADGYIIKKNRQTESPVLLVHGCAGCGKSTFLYQISQQRKNCVSLIADDSDNECEILIYDLQQAIHTVFPEERPSSEVKTEQITDALCERNVVLLIDNADKISSDKAASIIEKILSHAVEGEFNVVLAMRVIPDYLLSFVLNGECKTIGPAELAFTEEETELCFPFYIINTPVASFFLNSDGKAVEQVVKSLYTYTEGWSALIAIILKTVAGYESISEINWASIAEKTFLSRYVSYNLLKSLPDEVAEYTRLTALFDECDSEFCKNVFGIFDSQRLFGYLVENGIIIDKTAVGKNFPIYIPALRQVLCGLTSHDEKKRYIENAAEYYIDCGMLSQAVNISADNGNISAVSRIIKEHGQSLLANGEFELVGFCGDIIEKKGAFSDPEILGVMAQYYYCKGDYAEMERCYNAADSMYGKENEFSLCRTLYNGLLRYEKLPEKYGENIREAVFSLKSMGKDIPFLYRKEQDILDDLIEDINAKNEEKPISVCRFGSFNMIITYNGKELSWRTRKAAELMAYMLENGGKPIERSHLLNILWHYDMPDNAVAMLHNMIYSIRKELSPYGLNDLIRYKERKYSLDMSLISDTFSEADEVCDCVRRQDKDGILNYAKMLGSYWGVFLRNIDSDWANEKREYYDRCYVEAQLMLAQIRNSEGKFSDELSYLKNALYVHPYSDEIMGYILKCYTKLGRTDKIRTKYADYSRLIKAELGIKPGNELVKIYNECLMALESK